jgi:hypothetical protein
MMVVPFLSIPDNLMWTEFYTNIINHFSIQFEFTHRSPHIDNLQNVIMACVPLQVFKLS